MSSDAWLRPPAIAQHGGGSAAPARRCSCCAALPARPARGGAAAAVRSIRTLASMLDDAIIEDGGYDCRPASDVSTGCCATTAAATCFPIDRGCSTCCTSWPATAGAMPRYEIISGYRSPATNAMLAATSGRRFVAEPAHAGHAPSTSASTGVPTARLRDLALARTGRRRRLLSGFGFRAPGPRPGAAAGADESTTVIHRRVDALRAGHDPTFVARLASGWAVLGERQVLPGYCLLLPDPVVPTLNALTGAGARGLPRRHGGARRCGARGHARACASTTRSSATRTRRCTRT